MVNTFYPGQKDYIEKLNEMASAQIIPAQADWTAALGTLGYIKNKPAINNVDNTSDANKPVSIAQQAALDLKAPKESPAFTGLVTGITKPMVGLSNVDNTSDANKPVSITQAAAIALKFDKTGGAINGDISFSGSSRRLTGDMSNATHSNRVMAQTSTANSPSVFGVIPTGTGVASQFSAYSTSNPDNSAAAQLLGGSARCAVISTATGSAPLLPLGFDTNGLERFRIGINGEFLFATTVSGGPISNRTNGFRLDPTTKAISARATSSHEFGVPGASGSHIQFYTDNGTAFVGAGNISSSGSTTSYSTSSDYRLKFNVVNLENSLDYVYRLRPVGWNWADGSNGEGFIAHEVQGVCPQAVVGTKDGLAKRTMYDENGEPYTVVEPAYQGMDASFLTGRIVGSIKELKNLVEDLTSKMADATAIIDKLTARVTELEKG